MPITIRKAEAAEDRQRTISHHVRCILKKLHVENRVAALLAAQRLTGLGGPPSP